MLEEQAQRTGRAQAHAAVARCRGLLAHEDLDTRFDDAPSLHDRVTVPFERARTELYYGERLRQTRQATRGASAVKASFGRL